MAPDNNRVLIVDDQKEIHRDFEDILTPGAAHASTDALADAFVGEDVSFFLPEFEFLHALSGEEACGITEAAVQSNRPIAVAYVDIRMPPGIDGIETIRRMRKIDRDVEVVIMTAYTDKSLPEIIHDMEMPHKLLYIKKPFTFEEIQQTTLSLVVKWNAERAVVEKQRQLKRSFRRLEAVLDATGDAMAMYDTFGRLVFANQKYEKLFDMAESELREISPNTLTKRFQDPGLPDLEGRLLFEGGGEVVADAGGGRGCGQRLFYRSTAPVRGSEEDGTGQLVVYRDVSREIETEKVKAEVLRLRTMLEGTYSVPGMVGSSPTMQQVYTMMQQAAESDITVLIRGETGTGKELVARSFHFNSVRKKGPFLAINCAALPATLIESELFGHEEGAFTGATRRKTGLFERAEGGTILLDEIGEMPFSLQARLLRVLQEREIQRLGGTDIIPTDVRVIAATNRNLENEVQAGNFRQDLFYRLSVFPVEIPPLRKRREDIPPLADHFLKKYAERNHKSISGFSATALRALLQYDWPGNVRELENAVERAVLLETTEVLQADNLPPQLWNPAPVSGDQPAEGPVLPMEVVERRTLAHALQALGHNVSETARALGFSRATLYRKLKKYNLQFRAY